MTSIFNQLKAIRDKITNFLIASEVKEQDVDTEKNARFWFDGDGNFTLITKNKKILAIFWFFIFLAILILVITVFVQ